MFQKEAQELLSDSSPYEMRILLDVLRATKRALEKEKHFRPEWTGSARPPPGGPRRRAKSKAQAAACAFVLRPGPPALPLVVVAKIGREFE